MGDLDLILIEVSDGLATLEDVGQDATVAVLAVSGGDDKAVEYRSLLANSSAILLTKSDIRSQVKFDESVFNSDLKAINPAARIFTVSASSGSGILGWLDWLNGKRAEKARRNAPPSVDRPMGECYLG